MVCKKTPEFSVSYIPLNCTDFVDKAESYRKKARKWGLRIVYCNELDLENDRICGVRAMVPPTVPIEYIDKHLCLRCPNPNLTQKQPSKY